MTRPDGARRTHSAGFSLIELLVIIAVLGILLGIGAFLVRAPAARLAANDFKAFLQEARLEAVKRNRAVIVAWDDAGNALTMRALDAAGVASCNAEGDEVKRMRLEEYRNVSLTTDMVDGGVAWLPNGRSLQCNGSLGSSSTAFSADGKVWAVTVSGIGDVRVEAR